MHTFNNSHCFVAEMDLTLTFAMFGLKMSDFHPFKFVGGDS